MGLAWFLRRVWISIMLATVSGIAMSVTMVTIQHHTTVPEVATCGTICPGVATPVDPSRPLPEWIVR